MLKAKVLLTKLAEEYLLNDAVVEESQDGRTNLLSATNDLGGQLKIAITHPTGKGLAAIPTMSIHFDVCMVKSSEKFEAGSEWIDLLMHSNGVQERVTIRCVQIEGGPTYVTLSIDDTYFDDNNFLVQFNFQLAKLRLAAQVVLERVRIDSNLITFRDEGPRWHSFVRDFIWDRCIDRIFLVNGEKYRESDLEKLDWEKSGATLEDPSTFPEDYSRGIFQNLFVWKRESICTRDELWQLVVATAAEVFKDFERMEDEHDICWFVFEEAVDLQDLASLIGTQISFGSEGYFRVPKGVAPLNIS